MKKSFLHRLKPLTFLPVILMMCVIFSFSGQNGEQSSGLSEKVARSVISVTERALDQEWGEDTVNKYIDVLQFPIRKGAHMGEYFALCCLISLPLYVYGLRGIRLFAAAVLFCAVFAATDEFHQSFIGGRGPSVRDVFIDTAGAVIAGTAVRLLCVLPAGKVRTECDDGCADSCGVQPSK